MKVFLDDLAFLCALGNSPKEIWRNAVQNPLVGMQKDTLSVPDKETVFGGVTQKLPENKMRCLSLLDAAVAQLQEKLDELRKKYSTQRIGIVLGSSNTGIDEAQRYINTFLKTGTLPDAFSFQQIELGTPAVYLKEKIGALGPALTVSTACSSSAKVFQTAKRLIENDVCDVVLAGGVDAKCGFTMNGFQALDSLSDTQTNPMSRHRNGINLGEGVALFLLQKEGTIELKGVGETSDAYHLTAPAPDGNGAIRAMQAALKQADLAPERIDYINLHGTGTVHNDAMESAAVHQLFQNTVPCSSTKPMTGHTLGASGAVELALCSLMLQHNLILPHLFDGVRDETLAPVQLVLSPQHKPLKNIMSNSFAFGGSNASVIIGKADV